MLPSNEKKLFFLGGEGSCNKGDAWDPIFGSQNVHLHTFGGKGVDNKSMFLTVVKMLAIMDDP